MHIPRFIPQTLLLAISLLPAVRADDTETVTISRPKREAASISQGLLGSQYTFFAPPIKATMNRPEVLRTWQDMPVKMLRYPGGTWADHYIWDHPENSHFVGGASESTIITVEEFLDNAVKIGAEPIIQVSTNSKGGSPGNLNPSSPSDYRAAAMWAATWVYDLNIKKKRGVKYWEIGNEVWIWFKPEEYARLVVEYSKAMKAIDPSIKIIACGLSGDVGPFNASWLNFSASDPTWTARKDVRNHGKEWTETLLKIAGNHIDYVAPHPYLSADKSKTDAREKYFNTTAKITAATGLREQLEILRNDHSNTRLAITEWVTNFGSSVPGSNSWDKNLYFYSHGNGINTGYYFGRILEGADVTDIAIIHELDDITTTWYWPRKEMAKGAPLQHPVFKAMRVWGANLGEKTLAVASVDSPKMDGGDGEQPASFSFASEDATHVYVVLFNLDPDKPHRVKLVMDKSIHVAPDSATMLLTAPALESQNFDAWEGEAAPASEIQYSRLTSGSDGSCEITLPAISMIGIKFTK